MEHSAEVFVGIDVAKLRNALALADDGRQGDVRSLGAFDADEATMRRIIKRLASKHEHVHFCYESGPTSYGLHRLIQSMGVLRCQIGDHLTRYSAPSPVPTPGPSTFARCRA